MMTQREADSATYGKGREGGLGGPQTMHYKLQTLPLVIHDVSMFLHAFPSYKLMSYPAVLKSGSAAMEKLI